MNHLGTKQLETRRLILRRFTPEDAQAMFSHWASDPEVTKYLTWLTHSSVEVSARIIADWVSHYGEPNYYQWAIVPKELGHPIGSIAVVHADDRVGKAEVGYCIGRNWWHQGYVSEALRVVIRFLMDEVGAGRVEARHDPHNPHSGGVMRKCGMTYEGTLRQADRNNQGICDACIYAILKSDEKESEFKEEKV